MDMMEIRRQMMGVIAGMAGSKWKQKTITVPNDMTSASPIYNWLVQELSFFTDNLTVVTIIRDNQDMTTWNSDDLIVVTMTAKQNTAQTYYRVRGTTPIGANTYLQNRNFSNNETTYVYKDETFTIFYQ